MLDKVKICICGGGHIAHSLAAVLSDGGDAISVYTRRPHLWATTLAYEQGALHSVHKSRGLLTVSNDVNIVNDSDCIIIALPRFAICDVLSRLDKVLRKGQTIIFIPSPAGLDVLAERFSRRGIDTIGFQRVPYVARTIRYGHAVWISDVRNVHRVAFSRNEINSKWIGFFEGRLGGRVLELSSFLSFTFSNSNPLLHPSRLVSLLHGGVEGGYDRCPYFYAEWTNESSGYYVAADAEMFKCFSAFDEASARADYESAFDHYGVESTEELTSKIKGIASLKEILAPWRLSASGLWEPDITSRYFTEDIPFGTKIIQEYAKKVGVATPVIDYLIEEIVKMALCNKAGNGK